MHPHGDLGAEDAVHIPPVSDHLREPRAPAALLAVLAVLMAGCAAPPSSAPPGDGRCGGTVGPAAPWCTEADFPGTLPDVTPAALHAVAEALRAACPPPTATDPTPGLSSRARWAAGHVSRRDRVPSMMRIAAADMERLLAGNAMRDRDRVWALDQLAETYALIELTDYQRCRELAVPVAPGSYELAQLKDSALDATHWLLEARAGGERACAVVRRDYPERAPVALCSESGHPASSGGRTLMHARR